MSKLDVLPKFSSSKKKSHHDLSHDLKFTCASGHLNPVCSDLLLPGDKIEFQPIFQVRCAQPLLAAAMADIDFHVDTFFVPMTMLYSRFEQFVYGVNEFYSTASGNSSRLPMCNFQAFLNDLSVQANQSEDTLTRVATSLPETLQQSYVRLATLLGYSPYVGYKSDEVTNFEMGAWNPSVFPYKLLAYNCVFENYFRLDDYTKFNPDSFNLDGIAASNFNVPIRADGRIEFAAMKYHPLYGDYFTRIKKSPLVNELNLTTYLGGGLIQTLQDLSSNAIVPLYRPLDGVNPNMSEGDESNVQFSPITLGNNSVVGDGNDVAFTDPRGGSYQSVNQLRTLFANEKLLMVTSRARKNYDAQTLAHFGVHVPHDVKHDISHLGSDVFTLAINELVSTADTKLTSSSGTTGASLGEYFGKGLAGKKCKRVKFTAPCHGVLISIFSCVPRFDYLVSFMKENMIQNRLDFFQPEYDALGMQPVYRYEVVPVSGGNSTGKNVVPNTYATEIQGWQYRYEQYKRKFNRATVAFETGFDSAPVYSAWALTRYPMSRTSHIPKKDLFNSLQNQPLRYVGFGHYTDLGGGSAFSDYYADAYNWLLYCMPSDLDQLFAGSYYYGWKHGNSADDPSVENWSRNLWQVFARDPFVVNSRMVLTKDSIMSTYSMPNLY